MRIIEKFKPIVCEHCQKKVDPTAFDCPHCGQTLPNQEAKRSFLHDVHCGWGRNLACFLTGWAGMQLFAILVSLVLQTAMKVTKDSDAALKATYSMAVQCVVYGTLFVGLILILLPYLKELLRSFKGWKPYVAGFVGFIAMIAINVIMGLITRAINPGTTANENQQAVVSMTKSFPLLSIIFFGIIGPICEEITYRVGLFSLAKRVHRILGYVIVPIIFGLIHFDFNSIGQDYFVNEILNLPTYMLGGLTLTFLYDKFGFAASTTAHIFNNLFATLGQLMPTGN